jgi:DNA modification methylase
MKTSIASNRTVPKKPSASKLSRTGLTTPALSSTNPSAPRLTMSHRSVSSLQPDPENARLHSEKQIAQIAESIAAFGYNVPILIDKEGKVLAGHGRLAACQLLGWKEVPTITLDHLTPEQARAFMIADNRLSDTSTWDDTLLATQLKFLSEADINFDLDAVGFEMAEIDLRIQGLNLSAEEDEEPLPAIQGPAVSQIGDLWQLGPHRLLCGNALEIESYSQLLNGIAVSTVFTDPPFNVAIQGHVSGKGSIRHNEFAMASGEMSVEEFTSFLTTALSRIKENTKPGAILFLCMDWRHIRELTDAAIHNNLVLQNLCVWDKGVGGMGSLYRSQHELVFVYKAGNASHTNNVQLGKFGRNRTNVWPYAGANSFARKTDEGNLLALHPTVKPVALVADALLDASLRGESVLDPFMGSGTTILAAEQTGRIAYGIELDPHYVDVAIQRWQRKTGQKAIHAVSGELFDDVLEQGLSEVTSGEGV